MTKLGLRQKKVDGQVFYELRMKIGLQWITNGLYTTRESAIDHVEEQYGLGVLANNFMDDFKKRLADGRYDHA